MRTLICRQILCIFKRVPSVKAASVQLKRDDEVANDGPKLLSVATQMVGDNDATSDRKRRRRRRSREIKRKRKARREKIECIEMERRRIEREESPTPITTLKKGDTLRKG